MRVVGIQSLDLAAYKCGLRDLRFWLWALALAFGPWDLGCGLWASGKHSAMFLYAIVIQNCDTLNLKPGNPSNETALSFELSLGSRRHPDVCCITVHLMKPGNHLNKTLVSEMRHNACLKSLPIKSVASTRLTNSRRRNPRTVNPKHGLARAGNGWQRLAKKKTHECDRGRLGGPAAG